MLAHPPAIRAAIPFAVRPNLLAARVLVRQEGRPYIDILLQLQSAGNMSQTEEYDLVTIGAGSGGVRASRFAATLYKAKVSAPTLQAATPWL